MYGINLDHMQSIAFLFRSVKSHEGCVAFDLVPGIAAVFVVAPVFHPHREKVPREPG